MEALGIDYRLLIAQIVNFILFFLIFKKFFVPPLGRYLSQQKATGEEKEKLVAELKKKEEMMTAEQKEILESAKAQAGLILKDVQESAEEIRKDLLQKAQAEADHIKTQARRHLEEERVTLSRELKKDILKTSALMLKSVLKEVIDEDTNQMITDKLIQKLKSAPAPTAAYEN